MALDVTAAGVSADSYATLLEAEAYIAARLHKTAWEDAAGAPEKETALKMAARVLNNMAMPYKYLVPAQNGIAAHYRIARQWTGLVVTHDQVLAWPRSGMFGRNGNSLDLAITSISVANPTVITTERAHGRVTGDTVFIDGVDSTPTVNGSRAITVTSSTTFTVAVNVTVAGTTGRVYFIPKELKEAQIELALALLVEDRTLENDIVTKGITSVKAGSVSLTFKQMVENHILPHYVLAMMPPSWFTDEIVESALSAEFEVL